MNERARVVRVVRVVCMIMHALEAKHSTRKKWETQTHQQFYHLFFTL
jgi:hypothetical protein